MLTAPPQQFKLHKMILFRLLLHLPSIKCMLHQSWDCIYPVSCTSAYYVPRINETTGPQLLPTACLTEAELTLFLRTVNEHQIGDSTFQVYPIYLQYVLGQLLFVLFNKSFEITASIKIKTMTMKYN